MNNDNKSNSWWEGRMAKKIQDHVNPYEAGSTKHADWQEGHDYVVETLTLDDAATATTPGEPVASSPFGWVIAEDGTAYALNRQYYHGVVCALLYPELAKAHEVGLPERDDHSVLAYQRFEHDLSDQMKVIRISISSMVGTTYFSKASKHHASDAQIQSVLACCKDLGYSGRQKIETEYGSQTVAQIIERLRGNN